MQKVLIVRLSAMGDILHALPAVTALRKTHPELDIGWLIEDRWQPLLRAHADASPPSAEQPLVNRVHITKMAQWRKSWLGSETRIQLKALRDELRAASYDAVIDFQGALRSALFARASRAPRILGEDEPREWIARYLFSERVRTTGTHVIEQDVEVASALNQHKLAYTPPLLPQQTDAKQWAESLAQGRPLVLMNPGAGWGAKCWPAERYGRVAQALWNLGCTVLVNAGPAERVLANQVVNESGNTARVVECRLQQLIELTRLCALFVGGDTGPMHLAAALQIPVVAIFGPTDPARNGPFATQAVVLRSPTSKRDHARRSDPEEGLLTITPAEVIAASRNLLGGRV
jgi:heptosyltransferase I